MSAPLEPRLLRAVVPADSRAGRLLCGMRPPDPLPRQRRDALLAELRRRVRRARHRTARTGAAAALALAASIAVLLGTLRSPVPTEPMRPPAAPLASSTDLSLSSDLGPGEGWVRLPLSELGALDVSDNAQVDALDLAGERQLRLASGTLRAHVASQNPARPLAIVTPHLRVVVVGTFFEVRVEERFTWVELFQGRVRVEAGPRVVLLSPGESIRSDDPQLRAALLPVRSDGVPASPASAMRCDVLTEAALRRRCLEPLTIGRSMAAQNALFALAQLARGAEHQPDRALAHWRDYLARFPEGPLAPEAQIAILDTLLDLRRPVEALETAVDFQRRFRDHPRAPEVALAQARLLCDDPARRSEGQRLLDRLSAHLSTSVRNRALRLRADCVGPSQFEDSTAPSRGPGD